MQREGEAVHLVAKDVHRAGGAHQELYGVLQRTTTETTATDPILSTRATVAKGSHRPVRVEVEYVPAGC